MKNVTTNEVVTEMNPSVDEKSVQTSETSLQVRVRRTRVSTRVKGGDIIFGCGRCSGHFNDV